MMVHKQPRPVFLLALGCFFLCALFPIACMLAHLLYELWHRPEILTNILISSRQLILLGRSLAVASLAVLVALLLGLPAAFILAAQNAARRKWLFALVLIPLLIPPYVMAGAWIHLLNPSGIIGKIITDLFGTSGSPALFSLAGCAWCLGISFFPIVTVILSAGLTQLDPNLLDMTRLSGSFRHVLWHGIFPQIIPHLLASVCLVLVFVLGRYGVPSLLGINTYPVEIFTQFSAFYDTGTAIATALPLTLLVIILIFLQRSIMGSRHYVPLTSDRQSQSSFRFRFFKNRYGMIFLVAMFIFTTVLPFGSIVGYIHNVTTITTTLRQYFDQILYTSLLACLAAILSTIIALPIAYHLAHHNHYGKMLLDLLCWLPIAIPGTILALGLIKINNSLPVQGSSSLGFLLLCAYIGMFSAFSIRIMEASYKRADPNLTDAAMIDCRRWYQRLWHIDIPVHAPAICASLIIVFVLVVGELNATVLLIPPGRATLSVMIDNLLHYGANVKASILCLTESLLTIMIVMAGLFGFSFLTRAKS